MVYPMELAVGVVLLAVGYHLHYGQPPVTRESRRTGVDESGLTPDGGRTVLLSLVTRQAAGAVVGAIGLLLLVDGLGV